MSDPKVIYLQPWCEGCETHAGYEGRNWCQDDVWTQCDECPNKSSRYLLALDVEGRLEAAERERDEARADDQRHINWAKQAEACVVEQKARNARLKAALQEARQFIVDVRDDEGEDVLLPTIDAALGEKT